MTATLPTLGHLATDYTPGTDPDLTWAKYRHTIEHAIGGLGVGTYRLTRQREMADELRLIAD